MGDRMTPIPFKKIMEWVLEENKKYGKIFGVKQFYKKQDDRVLEIFGEKIETPFGPAAGPHTQLTQNIIAAYVSGCRFFELKTVQTLDGEDLVVQKPCIRAEDECYNIEWSTELTVTQAYDEYVKAWFALKILSKELKLGSPDGFIFNMSVGYDFKGISSFKIDEFIMALKDASNSSIWKECKEYILQNIDKFENIDSEYVKCISPNVCRSITLSTMHGCPSQEIKRIATYLINEKGLNTYVKCNPTLLGYEFVRKTLDQMGYEYVSFDDSHFKDDLQFTDAVSMFKDLQDLAKEKGLSFGVKLTNTVPVQIKNAELPGDEMYMSGKALYPIAIALAYKLSKEFDGKLKISYSGGADILNIADIFETGIWPITIASTLLKVGGYQKCIQIAKKLEKSEYEDKYSMDNEKLRELKDKSVKDVNYIKSENRIIKAKINRKVTLTNCFSAPSALDSNQRTRICENCVGVCPNRANVTINIKDNEKHQIIHLDKICNECGNCEMFCPYDSAPYKQKFTLFSTEEGFKESQNSGFIIINKDEKIVKIRFEGKVIEVNLKESNLGIPKDIENMILSVISNYSYII